MSPTGRLSKWRCSTALPASGTKEEGELLGGDSDRAALVHRQGGTAVPPRRVGAELAEAGVSSTSSSARVQAMSRFI